MRAGELRKRVAIESVASTVNTYGEPSSTWSTDATVWAAIDPVSGSETNIASELTGIITHKIKVRYRSGLTAANRLTYDSRTFEVVSSRNWQERGIFLELLCKEVTT